MVKTSEYNYIIKTIILSLLIQKPRLFSIHFCTKKLLEYFLIIDTYYDSEERDKKFLISSRMGHAFGRISVDLYREAADTLWSRSINGARCFDPVITVSQERALFRRQRTTRIESRRYLHPCTRGRRFNASFEFLAELTTSRALLSVLFANTIHLARDRSALYWYARVPPEVVFGATILWQSGGRRFERDSPLFKEGSVDVEIAHARLERKSSGRTVLQSSFTTHRNVSSGREIVKLFFGKLNVKL